MDTLSGDASVVAILQDDALPTEAVGPRSFDHPYVQTSPVTRGPVLSSEQAAHHRRAVAALSGHPATQDIALKLARCRLARSVPRNARKDVVRYRCRLMLCPYCQGEWTPKKGEAANVTFRQFPDDRVHFVTVLLGDIGPSGPQVRPDATALAAPVIQARKTLDRAFDALNATAWVAAGGIEFEEVAYPATGNKRAYLLALHEGTIPTDRASSLVLHAHFFLTAQRDGRFMDAGAIRAAWAGAFPLSYQLRIQTDKPPDKSEPIRSGVHYALKAFTDFSPDRLAQVALITEAAGRRHMAFSRKRGLKALLSGASASETPPD